MSRIFPEVDLSSIAWFQEGPGVRNNQFTDKGVKLLNVRNIVDNELVVNNTTTHISVKEAYSKYKHFMVEEGDLIIASSGIKVDYFNKKIAFAKKGHLPLCMNTSTIRFRTLDPRILDINYFQFYLRTKHFTKQVDRLITGSAQLNFGPSHLKQMKVLLPPLPIQKQIAAILEKADAAREKRRQANKLTEQFLQSAFLEMSIKKNYKKLPISEFITGTQQTDPKKEPNKWFKYIDIESIDNKAGRITETKEFFGKVAPSRARRVVKRGDVIVSTVRPNLNATALVSAEYDGQLCSTGFCVLRTNNKMNNRYLFAFTRLPAFVKQLISKMKGASYPAVNNSDVLDVRIPVPPLSEQQKFATLVEKVEQLRAKQCESEKVLENLFGSLMQKAFKGELLS
ncbi:MAG: restriction endonuclease subunit S [Bacteroidota bacterium]|nr:restriction endonuclease subunit S [Bacteroidota bacterium]